MLLFSPNTSQPPTQAARKEWDCSGFPWKRCWRACRPLYVNTKQARFLEWVYVAWAIALNFSLRLAMMCRNKAKIRFDLTSHDVYMIIWSAWVQHAMQDKQTDQITFIYTVPSISIATVKTKLLCWLLSQDIYKYDKKMNMRQNYRISHFYIEWFNTYVLPAKKISTFRVHPTIWCEQKYWDSYLTGLSNGAFPLRGTTRHCTTQFGSVCVSTAV